MASAEELVDDTDEEAEEPLDEVEVFELLDVLEVPVVLLDESVEADVPVEEV